MNSINGNAYKLCFWILAYVFHDDDLLGRLLAEVSPAVHGQEEEVDINHLLNNCPLLDAVYNETLRITASSSSVRTVISPTALGNKSLSPGNVVLIPCRQLHFNPQAFGPDVFRFRPQRFLERKALQRDPYFRPFGGGTTYCPGRFLARREVFAFITLALCRFEVCLSSSPPPSPQRERNEAKAVRLPVRFPKMEEMKPCLGIMGPARGEDVLLDIDDHSADN